MKGVGRDVQHTHIFFTSILSMTTAGGLSPMSWELLLCSGVFDELGIVKRVEYFIKTLLATSEKKVMMVLIFTMYYSAQYNCPL